MYQVYYTVSDVPFQFMYCGSFQFVTDTFILFQMYVLYVPGRATFDLQRFLRTHIRYVSWHLVVAGGWRG